MRFQLSIVLCFAAAALSSASPALHALQNRKAGLHVRQLTDHISPRPVISYTPKTPRLPPPNPPVRDRVCYVDSHNDGVTDDSPYIMEALQSCNNGGHVVFREGHEYFVATALDLTFLKSIDLDVQGRILFSNDTTYWQTHSFPFVFQNVTSFFKLGGDDVFIYGGGTFDGNGQVWYDLYASNIYTMRPVLIGIDGLHNSILSDLVLRYSPQYYHFVANSTNIVFDNINIAGASHSTHIAKNTDGWDTYRSEDILIQNSVINNGDDCVAFKPNSTSMLVQNLWCNGSHGISVGSLGQYVGVYSIVEDIYVYNISMHNASDGARIKVWPNSPTALSGDLQGGGGTGRVKNITYYKMHIDNVDYAIEIDQCYGQSNLTKCLEYPSPLTISDVLFQDFTGTTSKKYWPEIATFACSSKGVCNNIVAKNIHVLTHNRTKNAYCLNVDETKIDANCTSKYLGFN